MVSCCGFSRERTRQDIEQIAGLEEWRALAEAVGGRIYVTDGNAYFSRPGPRLVDGLEALAYALHPAIHPPSETDARVDLSEPG